MVYGSVEVIGSGVSVTSTDRMADGSRWRQALLSM